MGWLNIFRSDPRAKLQREIKQKMQRGVELQRSGKMREFARCSAEVAELEERLSALDKS